MNVAKKRTQPDDYWQETSFARKYAYNNTVAVVQNEPARVFSATCFMAQMQGISYLCPQPKSILDIGCGPAIRSANIKASTAAHVVAADYSDAMLDEARRMNDILPESHKVEIVKADAYELPFETDSFDVVVCYGLLMSLKDAGKSDIMRVAKYGLVAIEETDTAMTPEQRTHWSNIKERVFPGRIYWHDYLRMFGHYKSVIYTPLEPPVPWLNNDPPAYARFIVVKEEYHAGQ